MGYRVYHPLISLVTPSASRPNRRSTISMTSSGSHPPARNLPFLHNERIPFPSDSNNSGINLYRCQVGINSVTLPLGNNVSIDNNGVNIVANDDESASLRVGKRRMSSVICAQTVIIRGPNAAHRSSSVMTRYHQLIRIETTIHNDERCWIVCTKPPTITT